MLRPPSHVILQSNFKVFNLSRSIMSSSKSSGQWSSQSTNWSAALANHAKHKDPSKIPPTEIKCYDEYTMTIYDGFEKVRTCTSRFSYSSHADLLFSKAKFHYLVLPRSGFPLDSTTGSKTVPDSHLESLNSLLKSPHAEQVLKKIELASKIVSGQREVPASRSSKLTNGLSLSLPKKSWLER